MKDIIKSINEVFEEMEGYEIVTEKCKYRFLINRGQQCCEDWGYFASEDDLQHFVGADLIDIQLTDIALNKAKLEEMEIDSWDCGGIQFIDFETDRGVFQLAVYNAHNGYYGHDIKFQRNNEILVDETL